MRLQHVIRRLAHVPVFTALAVATIAIGIGANAAMFTVVEGVLLKPLPYPRPAELVDMSHSAAGLGVKDIGSAPFLYFTYREDGRAFQGVGLWRRDTSSVTGLAEPEEVRSLDITADVLPILGVQPALGRWFTGEEDTSGGAQAVILTDGYWRARFGASPAAIGRSMVVDGQPRQIVGVMPPSFRFLDFAPSLILPLRLDRAQTFLGNFSYSGIGRLKPGVPLEAASADIGRMMPMAIDRFPAFPGYSKKMFEQARPVPALQPLKTSLVGDVANVLWIVMGTIAIVLLIACANVANLLLVRTEARQQELAIRAALGADRWQIARELLGESLVLAFLGGAIGVALAVGAVRLLKMLGPSDLPRLDLVAVDAPTLLFTFALAILSGLLFGSIPVFKYLKPQLNASLRAGGRTASDSRQRHRARNALVVVQVALALVLLVCSGLMIRTFVGLTRVHPGFDAPEQVQTVRLSIPEAQVADPEHVVRMQQAIVDRIGALAGVTSVAFANSLPMNGNRWSDPIYADDRAYTGTTLPPLRRYRFVSPGLVKTMGNRMVAGRDFTWSDVYEKRKIAMVSENTARELWGSPERALGRRIRDSLKNPWREIVGVVSDERDDGVDKPAPTVVFWPTWMDDFEGEHAFVMRSFTLAIRSPRTGSSGFVDDVSRAVWSVNGNLPLASVRTLQDIYKGSLARTSFALVMLALAGGMALLLGIAGVYGVISYSVTQRTREIGIRIALGARRAEVTRMFVAHGARLALTGLTVGIIAAAALARLMTSLLFGVSPFDVLTYAAVSLGLTAAAVAATYVPAVQAATVNPVEAMRVE